MVITCSAQLILHCVSAKISPISIKEVNKMRFSLHVAKSYRQVVTTNDSVNWPLIDFHLVWLSLLKSSALVNDY